MKLIHDGIIYSYNSIINPGDLTFSITGGPEFAVSGVSFIKYGSEFNIMLLGGEETDTEKETRKLLSQNLEIKGSGYRKNIRPDPSYKLEAVKLLGNPDFWQSIIMTRIDLSDMTYSARYYMKDFGKFYTTITDDMVIYTKNSGEEKNDIESIAKKNLKIIQNCSTLFEICKSILYLPIYFNECKSNISSERHITKLREKSTKYYWKLNNKYISSNERIYYRNVKVLRNKVQNSDNLTSFKAPEIKRDITGYWKRLSLDTIGYDKKGNTIHGKTWIRKTLSWFEPKKEDFRIKISKKKSIKKGSANPGFIYVMRSAGHARDIFKIGRTKRNSELRAQEISGPTGIPDTFLVVQEWEVSDCVRAEKIIHKRLNKFRLAKKEK